MLSHGLVIGTPGSHPSSSTSTPPSTANSGALSKRLSFFNRGAAFCHLVLQFRAAFSSLFF
jgi:hypothetical protein